MDTRDGKFLLDKLNDVFGGLKCAVKVNVALNFELPDVEDRSCRCYKTHAKTQREWSNFQATEADL